MFKKYRKLTAVVLSLALVFTGVAFTPKTAKAETAVIGTWTTIGTNGWEYFINKDTSSATYSGGTAVDDGPTFTLNKNQWWDDSLMLRSPKYTIPYDDNWTVTLSVQDQATTSNTYWNVYVNNTEVHSTYNDRQPTVGGGTKTYTYSQAMTQGQKVNIFYDQFYASAGTKVISLTFTSEHPAPTTTTEEPTTIDPSVPQNVTAYNYYGNDGGYQVKFDEVAGADSYKVYMDNSAALATIDASGATLPASTFSTFADDALHDIYVTSVIGGVESNKSTPGKVRVTTKTSGGTDPTDIPRVYIVTNKGDNSSITKASKTPCSLVVKGGKDGVKNAFGDGSIKLRGNSTQMADKKAYNISFNSKVSLMDGRNKGKKWCLLAAAYDKSMLRSKVGFHLGEIFSNVASPEDHYVEVYLNGTLMGLYDMCEPADNGRSDIDYDDSAASEELMFELENGTKNNVYDRDEILDGAMYHNVASSNVRYVTEDLEDEVLELVDGYKEDYPDYNYNQYKGFLERDLASNPKYANWVDTIDKVDYLIRDFGSNKVFDYIDMDSFVDMYLVNEIMNTVDFNYSSVKYYIKMVNGKPKVFAGCLWDFDLSTGNSYYSEARKYSEFRAQTNPWFLYLMRNTKFRNAVIKRFGEKAKSVVNIYYGTDTDPQAIDQGYGKSYIGQMLDYMGNAKDRNYSAKPQGAGWSASTPDSYDIYTSTHKWAYSYGCVTENQTSNVVAPSGTVFANYSYNDHISYLRSFMQNHMQLCFDQWQPTVPAVMESDDLDITGYQMTGTAGTDHDKIGFRNVYQFEPKINGENVVSRGLVFGIVYGNNPITADDVWYGNYGPDVPNHPTVTIEGVTRDAIAAFEATDAGKLDYQAGSSKTASYYAMTMANDATVDPIMYNDAQYIVRAYVQTEGGQYIYSKPYQYKYYDVADYLYQHNMFSNETSHNAIYNNVLKAITPSYVAVDYNWGNIVVKP